MNLVVAVGIWGAACAGDADRNDQVVGRQSSVISDSSAVNRQPTTENRQPVVLFFGTSLTAGLGLEPEEAFPALIQAKIDSAGLPFRAVNAGVSGETSAAGLRRIDWLLTQPVAVLVLELGANDALRGQDLAAAQRNLQEIIDRTRAAHPRVQIVIAGMQAPPNLGSRYTTEFREMFVDLARRNDAVLIPFLLEGVGGVAELNQSDGIHPTAEGAQIIAQTVWRVLKPVLVAMPVEQSYVPR
ncbi:MAG TPA: arylesterase [Gemmatimonadales bacterium]|nr:arylesterase [Gemmatimonadales bacterium]